MDSKSCCRLPPRLPAPVRPSPLWSLVSWALVFALFLCPVTGVRAAGATRAPPALLLANVYHEVDLGDYWVSEKLDGVRAYWDGVQLVSRSGIPFNAPGWFTAGFPGVPLDGELWMGRGTFDAVSAAVRRRTPYPQEWKKIRFMVFDLPESDAIFDRRLVESLKNDIQSNARIRSRLA